MKKSITSAYTKEKNFMAPFYEWVQLSQGYGATTSRPSSPSLQEEFLVLIWSTSEVWKTESTLEPPSGFEPGTPGWVIQHHNR